MVFREFSDVRINDVCKSDIILVSWGFWRRVDDIEIGRIAKVF